MTLLEKLISMDPERLVEVRITDWFFADNAIFQVNDMIDYQSFFILNSQVVLTTKSSFHGNPKTIIYVNPHKNKNMIANTKEGD